MIFNKSGRMIKGYFQIDGKPLEPVRTFCCLGFDAKSSGTVKHGRVFPGISATGGGTLGSGDRGGFGGTKIAKNCMKTKELGIFWVADRGGGGFGETGTSQNFGGRTPPTRDPPIPL